MGDIIQEEFSSDEQSFIVQLYCNYSRLMYFIAREYTDANSQEREDIVQESLLKLIQKVKLLKTLDDARLANYIAATVRNTAINISLRQKRQLQSTISLSELSEGSLQDCVSTIDIAIARENLAELLCAINQLKPEERVLLEGKYYLGYDDQELAKTFATTRASIRMRLTRVRRKLLHLMKEMEVSSQ